jgi:diguanylate cyclase (GGDEF)-like protein
MKKFLREIWSASDFETDALARHAENAIRDEAKQGIYTMAVVTFLMMAGLACFYLYLGLSTQHLYTFGLLGVLAAHVAASAKKLSENGDLKVLYLLGMVLLSMTALAFTLLAQRDGNFTGPTLSTVVLLFMVVPLVPWGMREALLALATIYAILTGSTLSAAARFTWKELLTLQFLMFGAAVIALAVVARTVHVRKGHLEARFDLFRANEQLVTIAMHDPLTGVKNRRFLEERFDAIAAGYRAAGKSFFFCVLDVDRFKALNDTYGHACGDAVLRRLAAALSGAFATEDHVVRMGGDEFVVITRSSDLRQRFARAIERYRHGAGDAPMQPSVSLGAARVDAGTTPNFDKLYLAADKALYAAKADRAGSVVETEFEPQPAEAAA